MIVMPNFIVAHRWIGIIAIHEIRLTVENVDSPAIRLPARDIAGKMLVGEGDAPARTFEADAQEADASEKLSDTQLELLEEEPGVSNLEVAGESERKPLPAAAPLVTTAFIDLVKAMPLAVPTSQSE